MEKSPVPLITIQTFDDLLDDKNISIVEENLCFFHCDELFATLEGF